MGGSPWRWFFLFVALVGLCGCLFGLGYLGVQRLTAAKLDVQISPAVLSLSQGGTATLTVTITNAGLQEARLRYVVIPKAWLDGFLVVDSKPVFLRVEERGDKQALVYDFVPVPAGGELQVQLKVQARKPGEYNAAWEWVFEPGGTVRFVLPGVVQPAVAMPTAPAAQPSPMPVTVAEQTPFPDQNNSALVERLAKSVVMIVALDRQDGHWQPLWSGSGTVIDPRGYVLTNAHVVLTEAGTPPDDLLVLVTHNPDESPEPAYRARVVTADPKLDLAVIFLDRDAKGHPLSTPPKLPAVPLGDSDQLHLGDPLLILGYPGIGGNTITFTRGEVSGFVEQPGYGSRAWIKTSATIAGGSSGGLAANLRGEIVGIPTQVGASKEVVDCRYLVDTNGDGSINNLDACVPIGGFLNSLRPINLAKPLIEVALHEGMTLPTPTPQKSETLQKLLIFRERFNQAETGYWLGKDTGNSAAWYAAGHYFVQIRDPEWVVWFSYEGATERDVLVQARFQVVEPTGEGDVGVLCREDVNGNFYAFSVSEDGYYAIWMRYQKEIQILVQWKPLPTGVILVPGQWVTVSASCVGSNLALWVNDDLIATVQDDRLAQGFVGFILGTWNIGGLTVAVDDFEVYRVLP